jgi:CBS domain-containing protein
MQVSDIMTRRVISVVPDESIDAAIELMLKRHISGLPVINDKSELVGIVTESDFLRRPETSTEHKTGSRWRDTFFNFSKVIDNYVHSHGVKVKDVMTPNPVAVTEDTPLDRVVQLMQTRNVKRLPVVRDGKVIGIISRANLMRALVSIHREAHGAAKDDAKIRERILDDIAGHTWAEDVVVDVVVHNGVADLWGTVSKAEQAQALRVLVESTPGVKRVEHYLTCHGELLSVK